MPIDLHLHSTHSDGTLTPAEIIAKAKSLGLTAVALTDHNTVSGVPAFLEEAHRHGVTAVAGTELSTVYKGKEVHLLGLFIPEEAFPAVTALTEDYLTRKEQSNRELVRQVSRAVGDRLPPQEKLVITLRYGLEGHPPHRQREVAAVTGISRSYVSRIEKRALQKLRSALE